MSNTSLLGSYGAQDNSALMFRNRIINGAMVIDQRNAGASVTPTNGQYTVDRWRAGLSQASKFSVQQSTTAPSGYSNSLLVTSLSAYSVPAGETYTIAQFIEGFNVADLAWGTLSAQTVTISFWARSSLTGTFGGALQNSASNRSYPFTYSISLANTWEYKTITVSGDTTGTWTTDNTAGLRLWFGLGVGSAGSAAAGAWTAGDYRSATGAVSVVGTNTATLYITGVQLEAGPVATPFERRPIGTELALCQRYYVSANASTSAHCYATNTWMMPRISFPVEMRTTPTTLTFSTTTAGISGVTPTANNQDSKGTRATFTSTAIPPQNNFVDTSYVASAEL